MRYNFVLLLIIIMSACRKEVKPRGPKEEVTIMEVINKFGGAAYLDHIQYLSYSVMGTTIEYEQSGPLLPGPVTTSAYRYDYLTALNARKERFTYTLQNFTYPIFLNNPSYSMIINDTAGVVLGYFDWKYYYMGTDSISPLFASRIEAVLKSQQLCNPLALLQLLAQEHDLQRASEHASFTIATAVPGLNISLTIDPKSLLPTEAGIMEEDFLNGDVLFTVQFQEWAEVGGTWYPRRLFYKLNGNIIKEEILTAVTINPEVPEKAFQVPVANQQPYDRAEARLGYLASQWYIRLGARGMIYDQPMDMDAVPMEDVDLSNVGVGSQYISEKVKIIGRADINLWSVAIQTDNGVVLVEAPLNPMWTRSIINAVHKVYPGQAITAVIPTHTHADHLGGIREAVPEARRIYATATAIPIIRDVMSASFTFALDSFSRRVVPYVIEEVAGVKDIDNGEVQVYQFRKSDNQGNPYMIDLSHSFDMVVVYVPGDKLLIEGDVFNAGTFLKTLKGETARQFLPPVREEFKKRARFLLDYISEQHLDVEHVVGIHGGLVKIDEVRWIAEQ